MSRAARILLALLLATDIAWRIASPGTTFARDLILYNAIWILALFIVVAAPLSFDRIALSAIALAIFFWGIGSLATSIDQLSSEGARFTLLSQLCYCIFYPLFLVAIPRISSTSSRLRSLELLDAAIFGLGFTSVVATILVTVIFPSNTLVAGDNFFQIFYPVGDIALLLVAITQIVMRSANQQRILLLIGVSIFAATDIYYLWLALGDRYTFASIADDGWLLALLFFACLTSVQSSKSEKVQPIHPALIAVSVFISPILLAVAALRPDVFPIYIVGLLIANLLLAFIRMSTALRHARVLINERVLARTDELTGLANRRRLLAEIENFSEVEGALMLLDLDGFKPINDEFGHDVGDLVLREVARRFTRIVPHGGLLARLGGDEFGVLLRGSYEEAIESAFALRASLSYPFSVQGREITVGVSVGLVRNDGAGDLLKRADSAMYRAKQLGMGVVHS
jgi:diguanylate cyclase (GGDEF)-like protein